MNPLSAEFPGCKIKMNSSGQLNFHLQNHFKLNRIVSSAVINGKNIPLSWEVRTRSAGEILLKAPLPQGVCYLRITSEKPDSLTLHFSAELKKSAESFSARIFSLPELRATHVLTQGMMMGGCESILFPCSRKQEFCSWYQTLITNNEHYLRISTPLAFDHFSMLKGRPAGKKISALRMELDTGHFNGRVIVAPPVTFTAGMNGFTLLEDYGKENSSSAPDPEMAQPGWNSWDYYRWTVSEEAVLANAEKIAADPVLRNHVKRIIVDDGWQCCYGEWEANSRFPSGMKMLANELKKMNFIPGLWLSPGIVEPHAPIAQLDYDMLAMSEGGQPCLGFECMRRYGFLLDPTVAHSRQFLSDLFRRYTAMGYGYFKLDFLAHIFNAPRMHDLSVPRARLVAELLRPVREATRGKAKLLGCNYPFCSGTALVDGVRIGSDIHALWDGISHNVISVAAYSWMNETLWTADPDFALCRSFDTADDPDLNRLKCRLVFVEPKSPYAAMQDWGLVDIQRPQTELLLSIVLLNAGAVNLSDNLCRLNEIGLELAGKVVSAPRGKTARPLDLFASQRPSYFLQEIPGGYRLLLVNWTQEAQNRAIDLRNYGISKVSNAKNFWSGGALRQNTPVFEYELPPRSCLLIEFSS